MTGFASGAFRCCAEDGRWFYVKSPRQAGARAVISEWLGAGLAFAMNLPIRAPSFVRIPSSLIIALGGHELGEGIAFGSLELPFPDHLSFSHSLSLPEPLRAEILLFDYWIRNTDRVLGPAGGNPNLLMSREVPVALIDHGNAFDDHFVPADFLKSHVFSGTRSNWLDATRRHAWQQQARHAATTLEALWGHIPETWHEDAHGDPRHQMTLEMVQNMLQAPHLPDFPFWQPLLTP